MRAWLVIAPFVLSACGLWFGDGDSPLYDAPWPDERLRGDDGHIDLRDFPIGTDVPMRYQALESLEHADGFGLASAIYFRMPGSIDSSSLPSLEESVGENASVMLIDVDRDSPEYGRHMPIDVRYTEDATPFGPAHLLAALPLPGILLAPHTLYAAVVTTSVRDASGGALEHSLDVDRVWHGDAVTGLNDAAYQAHRRALNALQSLGVASDRIAMRAVFRTGDPVQAMRDAAAQAILQTPITPTELALVEDYASYCVYQSTISMPVYQEGEPPYFFEGGRWAYDANRQLILQRWETARLFITVPRAPMPEAGYPTAMFVRAGGGGDRPLMDRGQYDAQGHAPHGSGLAVQLAEAGFVGVMADGPLGGLRNTAGWDEQFALFNVLNLEALNDSVRQSALELVLLAHALEAIEIDASGCQGAPSNVRLNASRLALIAHSTGATIAPIAAAVEPRFGAVVLAGAGASWIRQVMFKQNPLDIRPLGVIMLGYSLHGISLQEHDPLLNLVQWAGESGDPQVSGRALIERDDPPDVLVFQGLMDTYIPPPVSNPLVLSLGLDLVGPELDRAYPEYRPLSADLALHGGRTLAFPMSGNAPSGETRVVTQLAQDGLEDGHEVLYQRPQAHRQLRCFLESFANGRGVLVAPADEAVDCTDSAR